MRGFDPRFAVAVLLLSGAAGAQFNPQGRGKKPKPAAGAKPQSAAPKPRAASPAPATEAREPRETAKKPATDALIQRYLGAALAQPGAEFPIQRLLELYRERDGKPDALIAELERRAGANGPERYAALLALAGVERLEG
ncbi:MAG TPA: hypothetical protein VGK73_00280, partial [Polyangiaceae bacterium]